MDKVYVTRPLLPDIDNYISEVKDIFNSQWLTNMGEKHNELETKLQDVYTRHVKADRIVFPQSLFDISYLFGTKVPISADSVRVAPLKGDHSVYVIAKNAAVDLIEHYYQVYGIKRFILRLSRVYLYHPNPYTYLNLHIMMECIWLMTNSQQYYFHIMKKQTILKFMIYIPMQFINLLMIIKNINANTRQFSKFVKKNLHH